MTWAILMVLMIVIVMQIFYYAMPINAKLEMNQICRQYALTCEIQNGLRIDQLISLEKLLKEKHLSEVQVTAPHIGQLSLGESMDLIVEAIYENHRFKRTFSLVPMEIQMVYKVKVYGRKVLN